MSDEEALAFLEEERTLVCATNGHDGFPHLMPLWFVVRTEPTSPAGTIWAWTYAKSQKVRNLERDSRCTLQVEAGDSYFELRGVMIKAACAIHRDPEVVTSVGNELSARYGDGSPVDPRQAAKRVALQYVCSSVASFDHRKLG